MELIVDDIRNGYVEVVSRVWEDGDLVSPRGVKTRELTGFTLVLPSIDVPTLPLGVGRGVNTRLAAVEALSLIGGVSRPDLLRRAAPSYARVLVDASDVALDYAAYGPRIRDELGPIATLLACDPDTRQAVLTIWRPWDVTAPGDRPCTLTLQFLNRRGHLDLVSTMRSQDVVLGLAYDLFMFTQLQHTLARYLDLAPGRLTHHVGSIHAYERDADQVARLHLTMSPVPDLPRGIAPTCAPSVGVGARLLLSGRARGIEVTDNSWYAERLTQLELIQEERP